MMKNIIQKEEDYEQKEISCDYYVCVYDIIAASGDSICRDIQGTGRTVKDPGSGSSRNRTEC